MRETGLYKLILMGYKILFWILCVWNTIALGATLLSALGVEGFQTPENQALIILPFIMPLFIFLVVYIPMKKHRDFIWLIEKENSRYVPDEDEGVWR